MQEPIARWNKSRECWEREQMDLLSGQPDVWLETWPASGTAVRGVLYAHPTQEPPTGAPACSLLATPTANLGTCGGPQHPDKRREGGHSVSLQDQISAF